LEEDLGGRAADTNADLNFITFEVGLVRIRAWRDVVHPYT